MLPDLSPISSRLFQTGPLNCHRGGARDVYALSLVSKRVRNCHFPSFPGCVTHCMAPGNTSGSCPVPKGCSWLPDSPTDRKQPWRRAGVPKSAGGGESHGANTVVWRWLGPSRASQTRRWSKFIHGRDSLAGEGAVVSCESALDGPENPCCYFCPNLGFLKLVFPLSCRQAREGGFGVTNCLWCHPQPS